MQTFEPAHLSVTLEAAFLVSVAVLGGVMYLRGGAPRLGFIASAVASLVLLHLAGIWRAGLLFGDTRTAQLISIWLNVSILEGTRLNPFRAALNSADLRRLEGRWKDTRLPRDARFVRPPERWPFLALFFVGALVTVLVGPGL